MSLFVISSFVFAMPVLADPSGQQGQRPGGSGPNGQQGQGPNGPPPGCPARTQYRRLELQNRQQTALNQALRRRQDNIEQ